jgi:hypothetical protein
MTSRTILITAALLAIGFLSTSCQNEGGGGGGVGNTQASVGNRPKAAPAGQNASKVTDGPAPLRYNFAAGAGVRVVDATTGEEVARTRVGPNTIVRVERAGVFAGDEKLTRRPLPADHKYEIWMDR